MINNPVFHHNIYINKNKLINRKNKNPVEWRYLDVDADDVLSLCRDDEQVEPQVRRQSYDGCSQVDRAFQDTGLKTNKKLIEINISTKKSQHNNE